MVDSALLRVENLQTHFFTKEGVVRAVDGVSFHVEPGEILGIVGESGCGKSMTARSILRLVPQPLGRIVEGSVMFEGMDLVRLPMHEVQRIRGARIAMIFQDPMTSLNPTMRVGEQIIEVLQIHKGMEYDTAVKRTVELLEQVQIPEPAARLRDYPHQFSGGMRQRAMVAMALAGDPRLLIADEPTTALDVTVQAQILDLLRRIREERNAAIILITHDLGVIAELCDRVVVMYAGRVVETAPVDELFERPSHPYTRGLMESIPTPEHRVEELKPIRGQPPDLSRVPVGCSFAPRCDFCFERCRHEEPDLRQVASSHESRCWLDPVQLDRQAELEAAG